ncbi:hypothetical protein [Acetobacter conturbans]|uniref:Uncharacterized protein n=1 Tax=Acetobacter conturbans TaxID=1737472 RepID=A0ABX0K274_9PROT|nr:hypothetical protein [Acetobacter conturbans]NHN89851.1 hypothetical protein [Acetobacter conturbans]
MTPAIVAGTAVTLGVSAAAGMFALRNHFEQKGVRWAVSRNLSPNKTVPLGYFQWLFFDDKQERLAVFRAMGESVIIPFDKITSFDISPRPDTRTAADLNLMVADVRRPLFTAKVSAESGKALAAHLLAHLTHLQRI